jgi:hypothetical protein
VPLGPLPTSQMLVSSLSPGLTGEVNRTPKNLSELGSLPPAVLRTARAAKPKVDRPWRMTPPKPAALPIWGSGNGCELTAWSVHPVRHDGDN